MKQHALFTDRFEAGQKLADRLNFLAQERLIIAAVPNGGIPIGIQIAQKLNSSLEVIMVHKLFPPNHPDIGFGALTLDGTIEINYRAINHLSLKQPDIENINQETYEHLLKQKKYFLKDGPGRPGEYPEGRPVPLCGQDWNTGHAYQWVPYGCCARGKGSN